MGVRMNRFDFYPGDWLRDTVDLEPEEEAIYLRLVLYYYSKEHPIEASRVQAVSRANLEKTQVVLSRFFKLQTIRLNGKEVECWTNERCEKEITKWVNARKRAIENGKKGGRPKGSKTNSKSYKEPRRKAKRNPEQKLPSPSPSDLSVGDKSPTSQGTDLLSLGDKKISSPSQPIVLTHETKRKRSGTTGKGVATWEAYSSGYARRYGREPVRNAKTNTLCCRLVDLLGANKAPVAARYYLNVNSQPYSGAGHCLELLIRDAQKILTEAETGRRVTQHQARESDRLQATGDDWREIKAMHKEKDSCNKIS